jgi:hypothetical protein
MCITLLYVTEKWLVFSQYVQSKLQEFNSDIQQNNTWWNCPWKFQVTVFYWFALTYSSSRKNLSLGYMNTMYYILWKTSIFQGSTITQVWHWTINTKQSKIDRWALKRPKTQDSINLGGFCTFALMWQPIWQRVANSEHCTLQSESLALEGHSIWHLQVEYQREWNNPTTYLVK